MTTSVALAALQWAIILFIAHFEGPEPVGEYALAQAFATPASYLAWLSIRQQYLVSKHSADALADFIFLRSVVPLLVFSILLVFISLCYASRSFFWIAAGVFAMKYIEGFFDLAYGKMQHAGDVAGVASTSLARSLVSIPAFGLFYFFTRDAALALFALSALWIAILAFQRKRLGLQAQAPELFDMAPRRMIHRFATAFHLLPFGVSLVVMSLTSYAPRFLIDAALGPRELGYFAAVFHFVTVGAIGAGSIGQALLPHLADSINKRTIRSFWRQLLWPALLVQCVCAIGVLLAMIIGSELIELLYGAAFAGQGPVLVAAAIAAGPIYCAGIIANGCFAAQMRRGFLAVQCLALATIIVATLFLVPIIGVNGAFAGMIISAFVQIAVSIMLLMRFFHRSERGLVYGEVR
jgi:O-antigen/teichoic acid export membrane protein